MSSTLFLEIREKHGLAYTVRGRIEREKNYSYYSIYVGTTKEALEKVKQMIIQGFKDVQKMTQKDLEDSKQRLIGIRRIATEESINILINSKSKSEACRKLGFSPNGTGIRKIDNLGLELKLDLSHFKDKGWYSPLSL
jgi:predicted Zn-dependent peptidase